MNFKTMKKALVSLFVLLFSANMFAWGITGHRTIAEIAEHHLTPKAKRHLKKIIGTEKLAYWANWPDFIKSDTTGVWKETERWHYVNVPPQPNFESFSAALKGQPGPNLYTQIKVLSEKLKDKNTAPQERETDLRFLVHLMGDMAQPMHLGRAEDLGGNLIKVEFFKEPTNLHTLWDTKLIDLQKYSFTEYAGVLDIKSTVEVKEIQSGTLEQWMYDSHKLANSIYAHVEAGKNYSYDYNYKYTAALEKQLLYGGLRLAKILNDVL